MNPPSLNKNSDRSLVTALLLILVFVTPFAGLWSRVLMIWYLPYVLWLGIVILIAFSLRRGQEDDSEP